MIVMQPVLEIFASGDFEPQEEHESCPTDPLGTFLHGLLTMPDLSGAGGFRRTGNAALSRALDLAPTP
ncbi:hypothetical protein [Streptomyces avidinii]